jgi:transcriptional regulator with XRE-family HTH domain
VSADPFGTRDGHYPERGRVLRPVPARALVTLAIASASARPGSFCIVFPIANHPGFGEVLRGHRRAARLTLEHLTAVSGVSARTLSDMERGQSKGPQHRTVTALADSGGMGKTTLAIRAAHALRPDFPGGVFFLDLFGMRLEEEESAADREALTARVTSWLSQQEMLAVP